MRRNIQKRPSTMAPRTLSHVILIRKYQVFDSSEVARTATPEVYGQVKNVAKMLKKSDGQVILFIPI